VQTVGLQAASHTCVSVALYSLLYKCIYDNTLVCEHLFYPTFQSVRLELIADVISIGVDRGSQPTTSSGYASVNSQRICHSMI